MIFFKEKRQWTLALKVGGNTTHKAISKAEAADSRQATSLTPSVHAFAKHTYTEY